MKKYFCECLSSVFLIAASLAFAEQMPTQSDYDVVHDEAGLSFFGRSEQEFAYLERTGKLVLKFKTEALLGMTYCRTNSEDMRSFRDGMGAIETGGKWGFADTTGTIVIAPQFDEAWPFSDGFAWVKAKGKWGAIDRSGHFTIEAKYDGASLFHGGYAKINREGKWGFVRKDGTELISPAYEDVRFFQAGYAAVKSNGKWGYVTVVALSAWPDDGLLARRPGQTTGF
jgi:hypothetical protein